MSVAEHDVTPRVTSLTEDPGLPTRLQRLWETSPGLYGFVKGHQLTRHVLEPSLEAASRFLPRNFDKSIDNFQANAGVIEDGYSGILGAPPTQKPRPFEIVFETPNHAPANLQVDAHIAALLTMLERFRSMIAEGQNI